MTAKNNDITCRSNTNDDNGGTASCQGRSSNKLARATVSCEFASQLKNLRSRIATTEPHYIRCLKPNDHLVANHFDEMAGVEEMDFLTHYPTKEFQLEWIRAYLEAYDGDIYVP